MIQSHSKKKERFMSYFNDYYSNNTNELYDRAFKTPKIQEKLPFNNKGNISFLKMIQRGFSWTKEMCYISIAMPFMMLFGFIFFVKNILEAYAPSDISLTPEKFGTHIFLAFVFLLVAFTPLISALIISVFYFFSYKRKMRKNIDINNSLIPYMFGLNTRYYICNNLEADKETTERFEVIFQKTLDKPYTYRELLNLID